VARADRLLERMRNNPTDDWRYAQLARVLTRAGFRLGSSQGSHRTWIGPNRVRITLKDDGARGVLSVYVRQTIAAIDASRGEEEAEG
jgi:hypothetical protein